MTPLISAVALTSVCLINIWLGVREDFGFSFFVAGWCAFGAVDNYYRAWLKR